MFSDKGEYDKEINQSMKQLKPQAARVGISQNLPLGMSCHGCYLQKYNIPALTNVWKTPRKI